MKEAQKSTLAPFCQWAYNKNYASWKRALTELSWHLDLVFLGCRPIRNNFLLFISHPVCSILLQWHKWTNLSTTHQNLSQFSNKCHVAIHSIGASLIAPLVKNLPAMQETLVWYLGWEDPLEKGMATHSSILAWRIPWRKESGGLQSMKSQK